MKNVMTALFASVVVIALLSLIYVLQYSQDKLIIKGVLFGLAFLVYVAVLMVTKDDWIVFSTIFLTFLDVQMVQMYTSTSCIFILTAAAILWVRSIFSSSSKGYLARARSSGATLPLLLILCSYTISFLFVSGDYGFHVMMYHGLICGILLFWMIVCTVRDGQQLRLVNQVLLAALVLNLIFSLISIFVPSLDDIRAGLLSLPKFTAEDATRLHGLSFRSEAYGEYLMVCGATLLSVLTAARRGKRNLLLWFIAGSTVVALILTRVRGANTVFLFGAFWILISTRSLRTAQKVGAVFAVTVIFGVTLYVVETYSKDVTLVDRMFELTDTSGDVGYVPGTRYYTWMPGFQNAKAHSFLGMGPSLAPYVNTGTWRDIINDQASGEVMTWPHNLTLLVLCTVGFYGLLSYLFLALRTLRLRHLFKVSDPYLRSCYSGYLASFLMLLIEGQKYDGILRHANSSFYLMFIVVALLFSSEKVCRQHQPELQGATGLKRVPTGNSN